MLPTDYRGYHSAPNRTFGAPLHAVDITYPADVYGPNGPRYYGTGNARADAQSFAAVRAARGNPDYLVRVYRAVPSDVDPVIHPGDWVTPSRVYAVEHGEGPLDGDYRIVSAVVRAGDVWTNADSINEWGWDPATVPAAA